MILPRPDSARSMRVHRCVGWVTGGSHVMARVKHPQEEPEGPSARRHRDDPLARGVSQDERYVRVAPSHVRSRSLGMQGRWWVKEHEGASHCQHDSSPERTQAHPRLPARGPATVSCGDAAVESSQTPHHPPNTRKRASLSLPRGRRPKVLCEKTDANAATVACPGPPSSPPATKSCHMHS